MSVAVGLERVDLTYRGSAGAIAALAGLDLAVAPGEFVALLGPSGCGKSTLVKLVSGLLAPGAGRVTVGGATVTGVRPDVGIVFQKPTLLPWKTVRQNVLVAGRAAGDRADALLDLVGLGAFRDHHPGELSGGMQQRVGLARALLRDPAVLLMDEPFAALDALTREQMALELQRLWAPGAKTVLFVTHSIPEAVFLADRVVVLSPRPARVVEAVAIPLDRPRRLETMARPDFARLCDRLRQMLFSAAGAGAA